MINIIKKNYKFTKSLVIDVYNYIVFYRETLKNYTVKEGRYAIVNIDGNLKIDDRGRYFYIICMYLNHAGFSVIVKTEWNDFKIPVNFRKLLYKQNHILVRNCTTPANSIVLMLPGAANHTILLSYGYDILNTGLFDYTIPYMMHPFQYKFYLSPVFLAGLEKSVRTIKIFFAGQTNKFAYKNEKIEKYFDVIPRLEVMKFILSNVEKSRRLQKDRDELTLKELLHSKNYINEVIISEVKTKQEDWLKILMKADFFICPPGIRMPWCHNCVEAMSAGAIPILEYADLFHPELEHLENCLSYKNYDDLKSAVQVALAMKPAEIENMRKNVLNYYSDFLSIESISEKIKTFSTSAKQQLNVAIPFVRSEENMRVVKEMRT